MFLYFTKKDKGRIKAVYSGRFAFISDELIYDKIEKTFDSINHSKAKILQEYKFEEIQEEFLHHIIFKKNFSSLFINGFRYMTRLIWRLVESKKLVALYYEYRTLFYFIMYKPQETVVDSLIRDKIKNINIKQFFYLFKYDLKYLKLLIAYEKEQKKYYLNLFLLLLLSPILFFIGFVISKFFTIILYKKNLNTDKYEHQYISQYGVVKDLNRKKTLKSNIGELIQFERIIYKINKFDEKHQNLKWLFIKYKSEYKVYNFINKKEKSLNEYYDMSVFDNFEEYFIQVMILAFTWADIDPNKNYVLFNQFILKLEYSIKEGDLSIIEKYISIISLENSDLDLNRVIEFFYMHGN